MKLTIFIIRLIANVGLFIVSITLVNSILFLVAFTLLILNIMQNPFNVSVKELSTSANYALNQ